MKPWYKDGLAFLCTQCGRCCGGAPGVVWVDRREMELIAERLELRIDEMWGSFFRRVGRQVSLVERANCDCVFLKREDGGQRCVIYDIRPQQCRTWPFWQQNLHSIGIWNSTTCNCPGINRGRLYELAEIEAVRKARPWHEITEDARDEVAG